VAGGYDWVTFLSDYGHDDVFVGVCKGVVARIAPHARVIDVCHLITPQDVDAGAQAMCTAVPFLPVGVHLGLVDPQRPEPVRGIAVRARDGSILVGPDNGLLSRAWEALGGVERAVEIADRALWLEPVHSTFRGRDVFAPVAAHLAAGRELDEVGPPVAADALVSRAPRSATVDADHVHAEIRGVDHFGNVSLNVARGDLEAAGIVLGDNVELRCNGRTMTVPFTTSFGEVPPGRLSLCEDSFRSIQLAVNTGRANQELRVSRGDPIVIARLQQRPPPQRAEVTT
jgi:S-adenosylmethionine hydrolase